MQCIGNWRLVQEIKSKLSSGVNDFASWLVFLGKASVHLQFVLIPNIVMLPQEVCNRKDTI